MIGFLIFSDMHLDGKENEFIEAHMINKMIRQIDKRIEQIKKIFIIVSGDLAWSGNDSEYEQVNIFLERLEAKLLEYNIEKIEFLIVPGNHDCEFTEADIEDHRNDYKECISTRNYVIENILKKKDHVTNFEIETCCEVQKNFNGFLEILECNSTLEEMRKDKLIRIKKYVDDETGKKIYFNCINTAWISHIQEKKCGIYFPIERYTDDIYGNNDGIVFSIFHHPSKWGHPDDSNRFDLRVEQYSDFIISGHEHDGEYYSKMGKRSTFYIKAEALCKDDKISRSGFSFLEMDLHMDQFRYSEYDYRDSDYKLEEINQWKSYKEIVGNKMNRKSLNRKFIDEINDIGEMFNRKTKEKLKLVDIFVYPEIEKREFKKDTHDYFELISSSKDTLLAGVGKKIIVYGDEKSGKTTLAKKIYLDFHEEGCFPIYIDILEIKKSKLYNKKNLIKDLVKIQYRDKDIYETIKTEDIILIIDNIDYINQYSKNIVKFIEELGEITDNIICFGKSISGIESILYDEKWKRKYDIEEYSIKKLRYKLKYEMIDKWNSFGEELKEHKEQFIVKNEETIRTVETILGKNYIPSTPFYILIILQALEMDNKHDFSGSAYGYYYNQLVLQALNNITNVTGEKDAINNFLIELARKVRIEENNTVGNNTIIRIHKEFCDDYGISQNAKSIYNFDKFIDNLIRARILKQTEEGKYKFCHKYIYYYYVAKCLNEDIDSEETKKIISDMIQELNVEEYANIIIFIIYLNRSNFIFQKLLEESEKIFKSSKIVKFEGDVEVINRLQKNIADDYIEELAVDQSDINPVNYRNEKNEQRDRYQMISIQKKKKQNVIKKHEEEKTDENEIKKRETEARQAMSDLNLSFKTMEILGQILKSYWGSLHNAKKTEIGINLYSLGLRALRNIYEVLEKAEERIGSIVDGEINSEGKGIEEIKDLSKKMIFLFSAYYSNGVLLKIADSVGDRNLNITYNEIAKKINVNSVKLANLYIKLEYSQGKFPHSEVRDMLLENRENRLVTFLIKHKVREFIYMYPQEWKERQKIADIINVSVSELILKQVQEEQREK